MNQCKGSSRRPIEVYGAAGAAHGGKGAVEPAATVHGAEDDDDVLLFLANAEWQFIIGCIASTTFVSTSITSAFST